MPSLDKTAHGRETTSYDNIVSDYSIADSEVPRNHIKIRCIVEETGKMEFNKVVLAVKCIARQGVAALSKQQPRPSSKHTTTSFPVQSQTERTYFGFYIFSSGA
jgi:hypothetical protein